MLAHGAEQVLIDGAIDRRAASSPEVADGLLMSTGAVLSDDIDEVVARTADAVELVRLPRRATAGNDGGRTEATSCSERAGGVASLLRERAQARVHRRRRAQRALPGGSAGSRARARRARA